MKVTKIRNIEKEVCTAEQKIAYNFAFAYECLPLDRAIETMKNSLQREEFKRYDHETIIKAFSNGFEAYKNMKYKILTDYSDIGKVFAIA